MADDPLLFSDVDLHLKQIRLSDLNELGVSAMRFAFSGFSDNAPTTEAIKSYLDELRSLTGIDNQVFDPTRYRRFAGDGSLGRGRYYSIAHSSAGADGGTLVRELRSYYSPSSAGIIQIFDNTEPEDQPALRPLIGTHPSLAVIFLPLGGRASRFASQFTDEPRPFVVVLPLQIQTRHVRKVIDLRQPSTARRFAELLRDLEFDVSGSKLRTFLLRPPLKSFEQLLPSLLEQALGGGGVTNTVGIWLRKIGANGLIFPSARVDAVTHAINDVVVSSAGWNFVDYTDAPAPHTAGVIDAENSWPTMIRYTTEGPGEPWISPIPAARIDFIGTGDSAGSWNVHGLRAAREALWRYAMASECMSTFAEGENDGAIRAAQEWLFQLFARVFPRYKPPDKPPEVPTPDEATLDVQRLGGNSMVIQEALLGSAVRRTQLREFADVIAPDNSELALAFQALLQRSET